MLTPEHDPDPTRQQVVMEALRGCDLRPVTLQAAEKLPASGGEGRLVAAMGASLACEGAVLFKIGIAVTAGVVHVVTALPGEVDAAAAEMAVGCQTTSGTGSLATPGLGPRLAHSGSERGQKVV